MIIQGRGGVGVWGLWGCGGCGGLRTNPFGHMNEQINSRVLEKFLPNLSAIKCFVKVLLVYYSLIHPHIKLQ